MRIHFALTMTCMVNSTALAVKNEGNSNFLKSSSMKIEEVPNGQCGLVGDDGQQKVVVDYGGELIWTSYEQNLIFSGTFWGSLVTVLPSMFFIERFSPRHVLQIAVAIYILVTVITPFLATHFGYFAVFVARVGMGLGEGFIIPTNNAIIGNWFPSSEKSTALSIFTLGNQIASAGGSPVVAALCASDLGWQATFYFAGILATIWSIIWFFTASSQPSEAKIMTTREREYLLANTVRKVHKSKKSPAVPYAKILTSPAFLAQLQCQFFVNMALTLFQIYLPAYFKEVLHLGVIANGTFTSIPNIFNMIFKIVWGIGIDRCKEKKILSNTAAVKISHGFASYAGACTLFFLAFFVDCSNPTTGLIILCMMYSTMGTFVSGFYTSLLSLAPQYTATMSAISMFCAMIGRLSTPAVASLLRKEGTASEWQNIFIGLALAHIISGSIFVIFGSGDLQEWAKTDDDDTELNEKEKLKNEEKRVVEEEDVRIERIATLVREDSLCL